jgi:hypothetical protein
MGLALLTFPNLHNRNQNIGGSLDGSAHKKGRWKRVGRTSAAVDTARGVGGSGALFDVLRRAVHTGLPDTHRHTEVHKKDWNTEFARLGTDDIGVEPARRDLRTGVSGAGIV